MMLIMVLRTDIPILLGGEYSVKCYHDVPAILCVLLSHIRR